MASGLGAADATTKMARPQANPKHTFNGVKTELVRFIEILPQTTRF